MSTSLPKAVPMDLPPVIDKAESPRSNAKYTLALKCPDPGQPVHILSGSRLHQRIFGSFILPEQI